MADSSSVIPPISSSKSNSGNDPIQMMIQIAKDPDLSDEDKKRLFEYSQNRFKHRRQIAYSAFIAILVSLGLLFLAAIIDSWFKSDILSKISNNQGLIGTINGFLSMIVAAYYGMSTWRPSS